LVLEADDKVFVLDLRPLPPPGTSTELSLVLKEERTFPLPLEQARPLATAREVTVVLVGSADRSSRHPVKRKELAKLRDWLEKRLALVEP
jgi:hypothetical protein